MMPGMASLRGANFFFSFPSFLLFFPPPSPHFAFGRLFNRLRNACVSPGQGMIDMQGSVKRNARPAGTCGRQAKREEQWPSPNRSCLLLWPPSPPPAFLDRDSKGGEGNEGAPSATKEIVSHRLASSRIVSHRLASFLHRHTSLPPYRGCPMPVLFCAALSTMCPYASLPGSCHPGN